MTIKTFIRRKKNRMTPAQKNALADQSLLHLRASVNDIIFSAKPVILDVGFGMGDSLLDLAERYPESLIVGFDIYQPGIARALNLISAKSITNVLVFDADALEILEQLPSASLSGVQLLFPDPWPKYRHAKRRFVQVERLSLIFNKLSENGWLRVVTDDNTYADHTSICVKKSSFCISEINRGSVLKTKYWLRAMGLNNIIHEFNLEKSNNII